MDGCRPVPQHGGVGTVALNEGKDISLAGATASIIFVATKVLLRQKMFPDKPVFVATKRVCRDKNISWVNMYNILCFIVDVLFRLPRQNFCRVKQVSVATNIFLSRQK